MSAHGNYGFLGVLLLLLLAAPDQALSSKKLRKECLLESGKHCKAWLLPYRNYRLSDYIDSLEKDIRQDIRSEILNRKNRFLEEIEDGKNRLTEAGKRTEPPEKINLAMKKSIEPLLGGFAPTMDDWLKAAALMLAYVLNEYRADVFPNLAEQQVARIFHAFYALTHGLYLKDVPDLESYVHFDSSPLPVSDSKKYLWRVDLAANTAPQFMVNFLMEAICLYGSVQHWATLEAVDRLIAEVPELHTGKVLELGAGSGVLSTLLASRGVDIIATDLEDSFSQTPYRNSVSGMVLSEEKAIERYANGAEIFIAVTPSWDMMRSIRHIGKLHNKATIIWVTDHDGAFTEDLISQIPDAIALKGPDIKLYRGYKVPSGRLNVYIIRYGYRNTFDRSEL